MTSEYVCRCGRLVTVNGEAGEWIDAKCHNCGLEARVQILGGATVICEEVQG